MTTLDNYNQPGGNENHHARLSSFLAALQDIVQTHSSQLSTSLFELDVKTKQTLLDKINPYIAFELSQSSNVKGTQLEATGTGMMYISSLGGQLLGAETISHGDVVVGVFDDACAYPVPTAECLQLGDESGMPIVDELLSGVIMLKDAVYKTGRTQSGIFELEHDLDNFQVGLPLAHYLDIRASDT